MAYPLLQEIRRETTEITTAGLMTQQFARLICRQREAVMFPPDPGREAD